MGNRDLTHIGAGAGHALALHTASPRDTNQDQAAPRDLVALFRGYPNIGAHILGFLPSEAVNRFSQASHATNALSLRERYQRALEIKGSALAVPTDCANIISNTLLRQHHQLPDFRFFGYTERRSFLKKKIPGITREQIVDARDPRKPVDLSYLKHYAHALNFFRPERTPAFSEERVLHFVDAWMDSIAPYLSGETDRPSAAQRTMTADLCAFIASQGHPGALDRIFSGRTPEVKRKLVRLLWKHSMRSRMDCSAHLPLYGRTMLLQDLAATVIGMPFGVTLYRISGTLQQMPGQPPFFHARGVRFIEAFLDAMGPVRQDNLLSIRSAYKDECRMYDPKFMAHQKLFIDYLAIRCALADKPQLQNQMPATHAAWSQPAKERAPLLRAYLKSIGARHGHIPDGHDRHAAYNEGPGVSVTYVRQQPATLLDGVRDFVSEVRDHSA